MKAEYIPFYLDGRNSRALKADLDPDELADKICDGAGSVYEVIRAACADAAKEIQSDRHKRKWLADNEEAITDAGGDKDAAWEHFVDGKIDELTSRYEEAVIEALDDVEDDEDEDEDGEGEADDKDEE